MFYILVNKLCKMFKVVEIKFTKYKWVVKGKHINTYRGCVNGININTATSSSKCRCGKT